MPNWTSNDVTIVCKSAEQAREIAALVMSADNEFDFDRIIPMPETLDIEESGKTRLDLAFYCKSKGLQNPSRYSAEVDEDFKPDLENGRIAYENIKKYGAMTWYDWSCRNWGTKWNSHGASTTFGDDVVGNKVYSRFDTAWSCPLPVLVRLSEKFPDAEIVLDCDYEGGMASDRYIFKHGAIVFSGEYAMRIVDCDDDSITYPSWDNVPDDRYATEVRDAQDTPWWNTAFGGER